ncbi:L,D-transpeptidase family protein [Methylococcaceae bacterium WWC4]|uniref:L,D-transpeptidase family protein n=1 Tax=Methylomonas sp. LWB TaxID=1905845 RepID=UPI0008D91EE7|nr:L,D-transpeptidase family protein [Methylomonas sp. LWB]NJA07971.1 L,D-transpeptidase family protein [Methylococcaceae bacterium WWC4]OHX36852.1 hypothetical protein BJL95_22210 [Methylomonas sp. LWB]
MSKLVNAFAWLIVVFSSAIYAEQNPISDMVVVEKSKRLLTVYAGYNPIASFKVALGRSPIGAKECAGDNKTPEGLFRVTEHKANSNYHRALRLSYPERIQSEFALAKGCEPGGDIMIHGLRNGLGWIGKFHSLMDWTRGCIALTNEEIEQIWALVPDGTKVEIRP